MNDYQKILLQFLKFYGYAGRPMSFLDISHHLRSSGVPLPPNKIRQILNELITKNFILEEDGFYKLTLSNKLLALDRRRQDVLFDKKWKKFLGRAIIFRFIPFIEVVFGSGSMSLGNVHEKSDFDVLVIASDKRIFTARFFSMLILGILGWRRRGVDHGDKVSNKICLNHFITSKSLCLDNPRDFSLGELYYNLIPIYGSSGCIERFFEANDWVGKRLYLGDIRTSYKKNLCKIFIEFLLSGFLGNFLEKILKFFQLRRINSSLLKNIGYKPRLKFTDDELEFHPDTRRIENWISSLDQI